MKILNLATALTGPLPSFFPRLMADIPIPDGEVCVGGLSRSTHTMLSGDHLRGHDCSEWPTYKPYADRIFGDGYYSQAVMNCYNQQNGVVVGLHHEKPPLWGAFAIVSIGEPTIMSFVRTYDVDLGPPAVELPGIHFLFEHGDVVVCTEETSGQWFHGCEIVNGRYSLVIRERG